MSYNPRMSTAQPTPRAGGQQQKKREEENSFMTLPDSEVAGCISDIGIPFSVSDLQKPNPQQIQRVFEWFAELLMNITRESVAPGMRAAADDTCGQFSDTFSNDTRDLMGFFVVLRKLLVECGIHDFTLQDLFKPERPRLVRIFSYIINFIRFRESQTSVIDAHFNKAETTKQRIEQLYTSNTNLEDQLRLLSSNRAAAESAIVSKENRINDLKEEIQNLKIDSDHLGERYERISKEQKRLKVQLEERMTYSMTTREAADKLRPYTEQSPAALEASLQELSNTLAADRAQIESLERRARALTTSSDAFATVAADVRSCSALLTELSREMAAEEALLTANARGRDALSERSNNVRDVERQEQRLKKQLENVQARTDRLRKNAEERRAAEARKMEELKRVNEEIRRERGESGREMERRRVRIEQTEKKMADLKETVEAEVGAAQEKFVRMESHIRLYVREMEGAVGGTMATASS